MTTGRTPQDQEGSTTFWHVLISSSFWDIRQQKRLHILSFALRTVLLQGRHFRLWLYQQ